MFFWMALLSCLLAMVLTPTSWWIGWRIGALDAPADWRRMHKRVIPRCGGIAIFLSFVLSLAASSLEGAFLQRAFWGGGLFFLLGLWDDIFGMKAQVKLLFQVGIVCLVLYGGERLSDVILSALWILMLVNAHNFVDGLDGLLAGTAVLEGSALAICYLLLGAPALALPPFLLGAACLGFRHFNRYPARIFAGDCGSQSVGFLLGYLSLPLLSELPRGIALLSPLFLFAYPLTDLFTAVFRRLLRGKSPFAADRAHLHHRICDAGVLHRQCVYVLHLICAAMTLIGVLLCNRQTLLLAAIVCLLTAFLLTWLKGAIVNFSLRLDI